MKFFVVEKVRVVSQGETDKFAELATKDLKYKVQLEKQKKIVGGGPCLDILADYYILETKTIEEMGEIFFNSPTNFFVEREVHPLGSFEDSLQGMEEIQKPKKHV